MQYGKGIQTKIAKTAIFYLNYTLPHVIISFIKFRQFFSLINPGSFNFFNKKMAKYLVLSIMELST